MTLANQDDRSYARRLEVKASAARRPTLHCGCPNDGRLTYLRGTCDHIVCGVHADGHECAGQVPEPPAEPLPETSTWEPQPDRQARAYAIDPRFTPLATTGPLFRLIGTTEYDGVVWPSEQHLVSCPREEFDLWRARAAAYGDRYAHLAKRPDGVGEAATQSPTQIVCSSCGLPTGPGLLHWCSPKRSWFSRLWRWMWLRG
jgi:hypothetical protein